MRRTFSIFLILVPMSLGVTTPMTALASSDTNVLATVRITTAVLADGAPLAPGTYELRLTEQRPTPEPGQPADAQQWVEFVAKGKVVAREAAEVLRDQDLPTVGASSLPVRSGTRVDLLKGGEFLRVSVKREHERYLIYLPVRR